MSSLSPPNSPGPGESATRVFREAFLSGSAAGPHFRWGATATLVTVILSTLLLLSLWVPEFTQALLGTLFKVIGCVFVVLYLIYTVPFFRYNILKLLLRWRGWAYMPRSGLGRLYLGSVAVLGGTKPKLWDLQPALPPLPLPALDDTLRKYLRSVRPLLSDEEYARTKSLCARFGAKDGEGHALQQMLLQRYREKDNWLIDWWESFVYLRSRLPLAVTSNWYGLDRTDLFVRSQAGRSANVIRALLEFKQQIDSQRMEPNRIQDTVPLCMWQYSRIFGTTRIPETTEDYLSVNPNSKHVVVISHGQYYRLDCYDASGAVLKATDMQMQLTRILEASEGAPPQPNVAALTAGNRDLWAKQRKELAAMDDVNAETLKTIETALFILILDETSPAKLEEMSYMGMHRRGKPLWFDKNFNVQIFKNARLVSNVDHTWADAGVMVHVFDYVFSSESSVDHWIEKKLYNQDLLPPPRLDWVLTDAMRAAVAQAQAALDELTKAVELYVLPFQLYGKYIVKRCGMSPDAYCQMAIQLAFYRLFKEHTLTYESGGTVRFKFGRTETVRTCSLESAAFVEAMDNAELSAEERFALLKAATKQHVKTMRQATNGDGWDRHLFGLRVQAMLNGMNPELFNDKAWNLPYKLSSSQTPAFSMLGGGFAPLDEDGFGVSYIVDEHRLWFHISAYNKSEKTSAAGFAVALEQALVDMHEMVSEMPNVKKTMHRRKFTIQRAE